MDAELYLKTVKRICASRRPKICIAGDGQDVCPLWDCDANYCRNASLGNISPVPIVAQWLEEHPEPKPLPEKFGEDYRVRNLAYNSIITKINGIIDYLVSREEGKE